MRVCLITPPSRFLIDEKVFVALGILKVGAVLEQAGMRVDHIDLSGVSNYEDVVLDYNGGAETFAITATTPQMPYALKISKLLKGKTILGGPHATLVHAAAKRGNQRGREALSHLLENFDCVVAGDGEKAIFAALKVKGLVDADDPGCELWSTSKDFADYPWPARHLVDMESYHYSVDGQRAFSLISQLGCLSPDTPILLASGREVPISEIQKGDIVSSYNVHKEEVVCSPVAEIWRREANDIWEVEWANGTILRITGEHPVYTRQGWKTIEEVEVGWISAHMRPVWEGFSSRNDQAAGEMVQLQMSGGVVEGPPEREVDEIRPSGHASEICRYDDGRASSLLHGREEQFWHINPRDSREDSSLEAGFQKPDEASGGGRKGISHDQEKVDKVLFRSDEGYLGAEEVRSAPSRSSGHISQQAGSEANRDPQRDAPNLQICGQRRVLDRAVPIRETEESRLYRQEGSEGDFAARGVLAHARIGGNRSIGLLEQGMDSSDCLGEGVAITQPPYLDREVAIVWDEIVSKRFIGKGIVHNITVHPIHNYIANGVLVHNCPFACNFCGGRNSFMLRRIRNRPAENVIAELMHMHNSYGIRGMMFLDDELNVNRGMVDLMRQIAATGVDWRLRGFVKSELFTEEQAEALYAAGFRQLLCGFESAHPKILKNINKKATVEDNTKMLRTAHKHGLTVKALMSFGHPGESEETIAETRDWLLAEKPDDFDCTVITLYPGTPYWDNSVCIEEPIYRYETNGDALYSENIDFTTEVAYYKGIPGEYKSFVWTDYLTRERLAQLRDEVEHEVRNKLGIPYPSMSSAISHEHSMGMGLPETILRSSK